MNDREPKRGGWRRRAFLALRILIGIALFAFVLTRTDLGELRTTLTAAGVSDLLLGFGFYGLLVCCEIARLSVLLRRYPVPVQGCAHLHFTGMFFSNFLPGIVGAEVYKVHLLRQIENDLARPIALLLFLRFVGLALQTLLAALYLPFVFGRLQQQLGPLLERTELRGDRLLWGAAIVAVVALLLILTPFGRRWLRHRRPWLKRALAAVSALSRPTHASLLGLATLAVLARMASLYFFIRAFEAPPAYGDLLLVVAIVNLASLLPVSFGALGVREGTITLLLVALGISTTSAVGVAVVSRCALWLTSLVGGLMVMSHRTWLRREELG